jgi:hypothetical protein
MLNGRPNSLLLLVLLACSTPAPQASDAAQEPLSQARAGEVLEPSVPRAVEQRAQEGPAPVAIAKEGRREEEPESVSADRPSPPAAAAPGAAVAGDTAPAVPGSAPAPSRELAPGDAQRPAWLTIDRGEGELPLLVPRSEELAFRVVLDLGILGDVEAGRVTLSSGVERYATGLPPANAASLQAPAAPLETGWIRSFAKGGYRGYRVEHDLRSRILPQEWPRLFYTDDQTGSENRRRELKVGLQDGATRAWYRHDGHCRGCENPEHFVESNWSWGEPAHCKKCKRPEHRVWRTPTTRDVPAEAVDMLSAVYLARTMIRDNIARAEFPMVDKQKLWNVQLRAGRVRRIETPAGRFEAREVLLSTSLPPGEPVDPDDKGFEGMFGIRGKIQIWMEARTGVPVLIEGELPVPLLGSLDVSVELESYRGTPELFVPIE